ncbi:MAG: hypothetical protein ACOCUU_01630 [Nanoarchaeota archaeon]
MKKSRTLVSLILAGLISLPFVGKGEGKFNILNKSPTTEIYKNDVNFLENSEDGSYMKNLQPSLEIWYEDTDNIKHSEAGVEPNKSKLYKCPLQYGLDVPNGLTNYLLYGFYGSFPTNVLFTFLTDENNTPRVSDARKKIEDNGGVYAREYLQDIPPHDDWEIYGTNWVHIAPIETTLTNMSANANGTINLEACARPGTVAWPERSYDLGDTNSWVALTNSAKYLPVTLDNFGKFDSMSWTNLPGNTNENRAVFYRLGNDSYNENSKGLVSGQVGTTSSDLETSVMDASVSNFDSSSEDKTIEMYENPETGVYEASVDRNTNISGRVYSGMNVSDSYSERDTRGKKNGRGKGLVELK